MTELPPDDRAAPALTRRQGLQRRDAWRSAAGAERPWADEVVIGPGEDSAPRSRPAVQPPRLVPAWLVVLAVLLAGAAIVAAGVWWQQRSRVIEVTDVVRPYLPAGPDADGCPSGSRCQVRSDLSQPLSVLARQLLPDAQVLSSVSVTLSETGRTVQTTIVLLDPSGVEVSATAQCVPGAAPIPTRAAPLPEVGPAQVDFVVGGAPGCSVAVAAQVPRSVPVPAAQLGQLAIDPLVQLRP